MELCFLLSIHTVNSCCCWSRVEMSLDGSRVWYEVTGTTQSCVILSTAEEAPSWSGVLFGLVEQWTSVPDC